MNVWSPDGSVHSSAIYTPPRASRKTYGVPCSVAEQELWYALQFEPVREENQASIKKSAKGRRKGL